MADQAVPSFLATALPLVGRAREQAALRDTLAAALVGRGSLVLIGGEAGIGKTALAESLLGEAQHAGALVLVGRCYDLSETPPYGPWRELFDRAPGDADLPVLPAALLAPERVGEQLDSAEAIVRRVRGYLASLATRQPLVLLLDDLHWADPASLDLLRSLARGLADSPLLVLATYRADEVATDHPLARLLPALVREARATRLDLRPLDATAIGAFIARHYTLDAGDHNRLADYLARRTEGNALFLGELLRTLEGAAVLRQTNGGWALGDLGGVPVPTLLRQVIAGRLARLGDEDRRLLAVAAVLGQEPPFALWAAVGAVEETALFATAERALAARILEATGAGVRFAHALIREALYEGVLVPRRQTWHRQAGKVLATAPGPDPDAVANHFQRAGDPRAAEWLVRAGERAWRSYAWLTAATRYEAALALAEQVGMKARDRAALLLTLAQLWRYEDRLRGVAYLEEAERLAVTIGDAALTAAARFDQGHLRMLAADARATADRPAGLAAMAAALPALEALTPTERAQLPTLLLQRVGGDELYHRGALLYWLVSVGRLAEAMALAAPMIARGPGTTARGLAALGNAYTSLGQPDEAERALAEAEAAFRAADQQVEVYYRLTERLAIIWAYRADHLDDYQRLLGQTEELARQVAVTGRVAPNTAQLRLRLVRGDWAEVRRTTAQDDDNAMPLALVRRYTGDPDAGTTLGRRVPSGPSTEPGGHNLQEMLECQQLAASLALDAGALPVAREWLAAHDRWLSWSGAVLGQSEGALGWAAYHCAAGNLDQAHTLAAAALAHATEPRQPLALLAAHRTLGELATATGQPAEAARHLAAALTLADACAAPYERALCLLALAELHAAAHRHADADAALDAARALLEPLEARPALARAAALAARLAAPSPPPTSIGLPFGLTPREADVLRLVAEGLPDSQIAARLFISRNTVNSHLKAIFGKLGVATRAAAARLATDHRLA